MSEHGSVRGLRAHYRNGEQPCDECRAAYREYRRDLAMFGPLSQRLDTRFTETPPVDMFEVRRHNNGTWGTFVGRTTSLKEARVIQQRSRDVLSTPCEIFRLVSSTWEQVLA